MNTPVIKVECKTCGAINKAKVIYHPSTCGTTEEQVAIMYICWKCGCGYACVKPIPINFYQ